PQEWKQLRAEQPEEYIKAALDECSTQIPKFSFTPDDCHFLAEEIEKSLLAGDKFETAVDSPYLDPVLARFMKIAVYASDMEQMMSGYLELCRDRIRRQCRRLTRTIQLVSYAAIGVILILVYQLLMLPLTVMSQM
ncbi:MAG: hypothetical protein GX481_08975, partial [Atopobium sp.]|nr:hypothetical protein [Atopobium sp.]